MDKPLCGLAVLFQCVHLLRVLTTPTILPTIQTYISWGGLDISVLLNVSAPQILYLKWNSLSCPQTCFLSNTTSYLNTRTRTQASSPLPAFPWALLPHQSPRAASSNCRISLTSNRSCPSFDSGHNHVLLFNRCQSFSSPVHALCSR